MKKNKILLSMLLIVSIISLLSGTAWSQEDDTIKIGVLVTGSGEITLSKYNAVTEHLSSDLPEFRFAFVPMNKSTMEDQITAENLEFIIVDPVTYVTFEITYDISNIATMETLAYVPPDYKQRTSLHNVGSVILAKADRADIEDLDDVEGISFIALDTSSCEGWWLIKREFMTHRIYPEEDFELLEFTSDPEDVVYSVYNEDFDAGTVPSGVLETMHMEGKINISDFKVIHQQNYDAYPLLTSTRLYPGWVFAKTPNTSKSISERISVSLLTMSSSSWNADRIGEVTGWTVPQDHSSIKECLMEINEGPFKKETDILGVLARFKYFIAGILFLLLLATISVFYVNNINSKLEDEIAAKTETEVLLNRKHLIEKTMFKISSMFTYPGDVDEAINASLSEIGTLCGANRSYLFLLSNDGKLLSNTHEWCSEGVEAQKEELQDLPSDMFPWWMSRLQADEMIHITDVSSLPPEASAEKEILEMQDIRSMLVFPATVEGNLLGFVGLDEVRGTREWGADDFETLQMFSTLISMVLKRRKTERALQESEQHLKRVLEGSNEGTWDVNLQEDYLVFNERYAEIVGYSADEITPQFKWMLERIHKDDVSCAIGSINDINKKISETAECEYRIRGKDGTYRWVYNRGKVVEYSEDGKPLHLAGIIVDISERKAAQETLIAAKRTAEEASRTKSEFLANMSHELRTPLNSVIGFSDILIEGTFGSLNDKQQRYVGNISKSGKHLLGLINDILDLSKIEAGKMTLNVEEFDIGKSLENISSIISPLALKKDIKLAINLVPDSIAIKADKGKFKQIIYNLLSNAIKFTENNGTVTISVTRKDDNVRVEVTDTGIGISEEDQHKLFKVFSQIDSSNCREYEGTGLGLVLVKNFVEMHGGKIWVESESDKGSSFIFELPLEARPLSEDEDDESKASESNIFSQDRCASKGSERDNSRPLILVVEDEKESQEILSIALQEAGYDVKFAAGGKEALELARELQPFAITLDIMIPGMDGWDVLQQLKHEKITENIPVVIVSILDERDLGIIWGAFDYFVKPIDKKSLLSSLGRLKKLGSFDNANVLVIDDDPSILELMESMLSTEAYGIMTASDGKEGIDRALNFLPDLIILDLMMPKVDGFDVISELKKHPETIDIPIIVCTAKDLESYEKEQLDRDTSFVMQKGMFSKQDLLDYIKRIEDMSD